MKNNIAYPIYFRYFKDGKMKEWDFVEITVEKDEYASLGVHKGMQGTIFSPNINKTEWQIYFSGDATLSFAIIITVKSSDFKVLQSNNPQEFKEYSRVQLITEKKRYADEGVHKGYDGIILDPRNIDGQWLVSFDQYGELPEIACIPVKQKDLIIATEYQYKCR